MKAWCRWRRKRGRGQSRGHGGNGCCCLQRWLEGRWVVAVGHWKVHLLLLLVPRLPLLFLVCGSVVISPLIIVITNYPSIFFDSFFPHFTPFLRTHSLSLSLFFSYTFHSLVLFLPFSFTTRSPRTTGSSSLRTDIQDKAFNLSDTEHRNLLDEMIPRHRVYCLIRRFKSQDLGSRSLPVGIEIQPDEYSLRSAKQTRMMDPRPLRRFSVRNRNLDMAASAQKGEQWQRCQ